MSDVLYDKEIKCDFCNKSFEVKKIKNSKLIVERKDSDFCVYYQGESPYFYEIWVCPHCGYAFSASFSPLKGEQKQFLNEEYIKRITPYYLNKKRTLDEAIRSFKLALLCASIGKQSNTVSSGLCMRLAWLYRLKDEQEEEAKYLAKARDLYTKIYEVEELLNHPLGRHKIIYLIGELNGRLENYLESRKWFNLLFTDKNAEPALIKLARNQWNIYKKHIS